MTSPPTRNSSRIPLWLIALLCLMAFAFQGTRGLWDPDEGRFSSGGILMLESGDWLIPTVDGDNPHLTKPPVIYWALAASFALLGENEWAARLPSALAYLGTGLFLFGLGLRLCPQRPWVPAVAWGLSLAPVLAANVISTDPILAFFETAAMYAFVEAWSRDGAEARRWYVWMWLGWGLAFMTKGPPGLLPLLAMTLMLSVHDRSRLRAMFPIRGVLLFVVVAFSWFAMLVVQQPDRLGYFLGYEVYDRVFTATHNRNSEWYGPLVVYLPVFLFGTLPWAAIAFKDVDGVRRGFQLLRQRLQERDREWLLLAWWLLFPLAVFSLAQSRLQLYVLPLLVPLSLMLARPLSRWSGLEGRRAIKPIAISIVVLLALKALLSYWPSDRDSRELATQLRPLIAPHPADKLIFVNMRPFYGLNVYLRQQVDGLEVDVWMYEYSTWITRPELCGEILRRSRTLYVLKRTYELQFKDALGDCRFTATNLGSVHADGNELVLLTVHTGAN